MRYKRRRSSLTSFFSRDVRFTFICLNCPEDDIHLLQTATFRLRDQQGEGAHTEDVDRAEHEEELVSKVSDECRCNLGEDEVEQPLRGTSGGETVVTSASWENIGDVDPSV